MNTVELTSPQVPVGENPYDGAVMGHSEKNQKKLLTVDAGAATLSAGGDLVQTVEELTLKTVDQVKTEATASFVQTEQEVVAGAVEHVAMISPEQLPVVVGNAQKRLEALPELANKPYAPYLDWVNKLDGSQSLTDKERKAAAINVAFLQNVAQGMDERSWYETGHDILGMMVVPDEAWNVAKLEANIFGDGVEAESYVESAEIIPRIAAFRLSLDDDERFEFDKFLAEKILEVDDNRLQQMQLAMGILGLDPTTATTQQFEKAEIALGAMGFGKRLILGMRNLNVMKRVGELGDADAAVKISKIATTSPELAKEVGVAQVDAASLGNPLAKGVIKGAPENVSKQYRDVMTNVDEALARVANTPQFVAQVDPERATDLGKAISKNLTLEDDIEDILWKVDGSEIEYKFLDSEGRTLGVESVPITLDELGMMKQKKSGLIGSAFNFVTSPNTLQGADRDLMVQWPELLMLSKARINHSLGTAMDEALKPIKGNVESLTNLSNMMKALDGKKVNTSYRALVTEGYGGLKLTDKEYVAFRAARKVMDDAWYWNNDTVRREMQLRGTKSIRVGLDDVSYAKPYESADDGYKVYSADSDNIYVALDDGSAKVGMGLDEIKEWYNKGYRMVKADADNVLEWFETDKGRVKYALVKTDNIKDLPRNVLNKVPNYLPKLREDANFFLKEKREIIVNGVKKERDVTLAWGTTEAQVARFRDKHLAVLASGGKKVKPESFEILFDREVAKGTMSNGDAVAVRGGLIRGKRSSSEIQYAGDFMEGGRTDALSSMQRYLAITADRMSLSDWRMAARTSLVKTLETYPELAQTARTTRWDLLRDAIEKSGIPTRERTKLLNAYDQVQFVSGVPAKSEQSFAGWVREFGRQAEKRGVWGENIAKYIYRVHGKSPIDIIKSATFNLTLGMFSLAQIPVQLFGASVAFSINPISAAKAVPKWLLTATLDFGTNEAAVSKVLNKVGVRLGIDTAEMAKDYKFWRQTGMYESVVNSSADAASVMSHMPYDAGMLRKIGYGIVNAGQTPYRIGELSNMRISFYTALEHQKSLDGKMFKYDDTTLRKVLARAEQYRLNMSSANKAEWQKGLWALPTQFKQIYGKYLEALFGSHFTPKEKASLAAGQIALFGAAGLPIVNFAADQIMNMFGANIENLSSEELTMLKRGTMGWLINSHMDVDALFAGRLTVSADIVTELTRALFDDNTPAIRTVMGASFTSGDKIADFFSNLGFAGKIVFDELIDGENVDVAVVEAMDLLGRSLLEIPASTRKMVAAYDLQNGLVRNSKGELLDYVEPNIVDVYARALGFGSQDLEDLYKLKSAERDRKDEIKAISARYLNILGYIVDGVEAQDEKATERAQIAATIIRNQINDRGEQDATDIMNAVYDRIANPRSDREKVINKAFLGSTSEMMGSANKVNILLKKALEESESGE